MTSYTARKPPAAKPAAQATDSPAGQPAPATPGGGGWDSRPADRPGSGPVPNASGDGSPDGPPADRAPTQDADPGEPVHLETPPPAGSGEVPADGSAVQAPGAGRPGQPGTPVPDLPAGAQVVDYGDVHVGNREVRVRAGRLDARDVPVAWLSIVDGDVESEVLALSTLKLELLIGKLEAAHRALVDDVARFAEVCMATSRRGLPYHQPAAANATVCGVSPNCTPIRTKGEF
jgi:hypothetical protein